MVPKKIRGLSGSAGLTKAVAKGTVPIRVEAKKEAGQGGTGRDVGTARRGARREGEQFKRPGLAHRVPTAEIVPSRWEGSYRKIALTIFYGGY